MKFLLSLVMLLFSFTAFADQPVAIGLMFGQPTGLTGKFWLSKTFALDADFVHSWDGHTDVIMDLLIHPSTHTLVKPYIGIGAEVQMYNVDFNSHTRSDWNTASTSVYFGLRLPMGFEVTPPMIPLGFFAEIAPGLIISNFTASFFQASIGARYYIL